MLYIEKKTCLTDTALDIDKINVKQKVFRSFYSQKIQNPIYIQMKRRADAGIVKSTIGWMNAGWMNHGGWSKSGGW